MAIEALLQEFNVAANSPKKLLNEYKAQGKKCIGVMPYYAPVELIHATGMVPMGLWGSNTKSIKLAKEYCATFYCSLAQLDLEMLLDGTLDQLDGYLTTVLCDTLRPMSQNIRVAAKKFNKFPTIFLAHPQNRKPEYGIQYCIDQYTFVKERLEEISGTKMTDEALANSIKLFNKSRKLRREFVKLAGQHPEAVSAVLRSAVLKASYFLEVEVYIEKLEALNKELNNLPESNWDGVKVITSGIICDNPTLLKIMDDNKIAIAADDVAHESRMFLVDAPEDVEPMRALALQFAAQDYDILLYDDQSSRNRRAEHVCDLVKENEAGGVIVFMQNFCDPEEMEYPYLRKAMDEAKIHHIKLGIDHQMRDFGQAATAMEAFADVLQEEAFA